MAKTETIHIRVNEQIKSNAEETLGMTISEAVNLTGGLPFAVRLVLQD